MLNTKFDEAVGNCHSRYSVVVAVARRARQIADEKEANQEMLVEKPVDSAIEEVADGVYTIIEPELRG